jgi:hypothetical protein
MMSVTLNFKNGDWCSFNLFNWSWVLSLAFAFDWRPAGTAAPTFNEGGECDPDPNWDGRYCYSDYQEVTEPDARAIGEALHRALETLRKAKDGDPEARADLDRRLEVIKPSVAPEEEDDLSWMGEDEPAEPELLDGGDEARLREFADMALGGPFLIG